MILIAIFAPCLGTVDPTALAPAKRTREPSALYWFGTDMLGRDVYSRVLYGARISLIVGFSVASVASVVGTFIGLVSGFIRVLDAIIMRVMDGLMSIPPILLAIALMALTRASVQNVIIAITIAEFPRVSRLIRGVVLSLARAALCRGGDRLRHAGADDHLQAHPAEHAGAADGAGDLHLRLGDDHRGDLSFIGAGTPPIIPSWGNIMAEGRALWQVKPYIVFFPAIFLSITVLAVNLLGDGLRDALDPRLAKRL